MGMLIFVGIFAFWAVGLILSFTSTVFLITGDTPTRRDARWGVAAGGIALAVALIFTSGYLGSG